MARVIIAATVLLLYLDSSVLSDTPLVAAMYEFEAQQPLSDSRRKDPASDVNVLELEQLTTMDALEAPATTDALDAAQTTPIPQTPKKLDVAVYATTTLVGLETLGQVKVFLESLPLGTPSFQNETVYTPIEGLTITIPAGAWLTSERRESRTRSLTLSVFELPSNLVMPGTPAGPGIDLAPHDQILLKPILVTLPLFAWNGTSRTPHQAYSLDPTTLAWTRLFQLNQSTLTQRLGISVAMTPHPAPSTNNTQALGRNDQESVMIVIGTTVGAVGFLALGGFLLILAHRRRSVKPSPICSGAVVYPLIDSTPKSSQEGQLVVIMSQ
jgi:hypothetical protein